MLPALGLHAAGALTGAAASMFVVILAQSAATSRAYAAKYEEEFSEATDLVGLAAANAAAAFTGTFVVNGSPTKAQIVDSAGGRSQLSPLTAAAVVLVVLVVLTGPLAYLPVSALAAVVFLIAVELIDLAGMRRILAVRKHEFAVALLTAAAVVGLGVEYGIILAIVASMVDHLRHSYSPLDSVLVKSRKGTGGRFRSGRAYGPRGAGGVPVRHQPVLRQRGQTRPGSRRAGRHGAPLRWLVLDWAAIGDVDYTASTVLAKAIEHLHQRACPPDVQLRARPLPASACPLRSRRGWLLRDPGELSRPSTALRPLGGSFMRARRRCPSHCAAGYAVRSMDETLAEAPKIAVFALGGTISMAPGVALTGRQLLDAVPGSTAPGSTSRCTTSASCPAPRCPSATS